MSEQPCALCAEQPATHPSGIGPLCSECAHTMTGARATATAPAAAATSPGPPARQVQHYLERLKSGDAWDRMVAADWLQAFAPDTVAALAQRGRALLAKARAIAANGSAESDERDEPAEPVSLLGGR